MATLSAIDELNQFLEKLTIESERDATLKVVASPEFGYYYGPLIVSEIDTTFKSNAPDLLINEVICYFDVINRFVKMVGQPISSKLLKEEIIKIMHISDKGFKDDYQNLGNTLLTNIRNYTYENKLLESAMTGYAPIIPYDGVTSKSPQITSTPKNVVKYPEYDNANKSHLSIPKYLITVLESVNGESLLPYLKQIVSVYPFQLIQSTILTMPEKVGMPYMIDEILVPDPKFLSAFPHMAYVYAYYFFSRVVYFNLDHVKVLEFLKEYINHCDMLYNKDTMEAFTFMMNQEYGNNPEVILEDWGIDDTYMEKQLDTIAQKDPSELEEDFDLSQLTDYIYRCRKYQISEYINSLFLSKNPELEVHSFYRNDLLITQLDNRYIIAPVVDIADDYKAKMILMDTDGNISIEDGLRVHRMTDDDGNLVDQITSDTDHQQ